MKKTIDQEYKKNLVNENSLNYCSPYLLAPSKLSYYHTTPYKQLDSPLTTYSNKFHKFSI